MEDVISLYLAWQLSRAVIVGCCGIMIMKVLVSIALVSVDTCFMNLRRELRRVATA